jgi:isopentenyl-diphosphate delta-isomerase
MIQADALVLHLNPLQECIQLGGNTNFAGLAAKIEYICRKLEVPVIVKEVGQGISQRTAKILRESGVAGIDTAGAGGTSWARVESLRKGNDKSGVGRTFSDWGIPTAESIAICRREAPDMLIIGSGGIRSGLDAAKAIALGADIAGYGLPILKEAALGPDAVLAKFRQYSEELKTAMFCIGASKIKDLKHTPSLMKSCPD